MNDKNEALLKSLKNTIEKCDRCGACTMVCPLYKVDSKDRAAARGKIAITRAFLEGKLDGGEHALREALDYCLLCKACTEVCPSKIMTDEAMIEVRELLADAHGKNKLHQAVGTFMGSQPLKAVAKPFIGIAQAIQIPKMTGFLLPANNRLGTGPMRGPGNLSAQLFSAHPDYAAAKTIAYFQGCAMRLFFKDASAATVRLLEKTGRTVLTPACNCCGLPQLSHGMEDKAMTMAKYNIDLFQDADLIVTECGSCGSMLKEYGLRLLDDPAYKAKAAAFSKKVVGLSELLYGIGYQPEQQDLNVTYHESCHLNRGQGVSKEPKALLQQATHYKEAPDATMCCGGAGTFQIDFADISEKILERKYQGFKASGADIVVAECPSCLMQLGKLEKKGDLKVLHISQVL